MKDATIEASPTCFMASIKNTVPSLPFPESIVIFSQPDLQFDRGKPQSRTKFFFGKTVGGSDILGDLPEPDSLQLHSLQTEDF